MIQIILCVILMHFQDQKGTVLIMLYISEGYAIRNTDVGMTSDEQLYLTYILYLECRPTTVSFQLINVVLCSCLLNCL